MRATSFHLALWLGFTFILTGSWTYAEQNLAPQMAKAYCSSHLNAPTVDLQRQLNVLRHPDTPPKIAIRAIISYLKSRPEWNGKRKHDEWQELVSVYNHRRTKYWINAPFLRTKEGDVVCWGETRGHLLIFRNDGAIFTSYNPNRPNPMAGPDGYKIDWDDPTLN